MKKLVILCVLLTLLASTVFAAGRRADDDQMTVRIGWTPPDVTGVFATVTRFMEEAVADAARYGINIVLDARPPANHGDHAGQIAIIENFILMGVDAIIVAPTDVDSVTPALQAVNRAGIPLIMANMLSPIPGVEVASFVGFDNVIAAEVTGWSLINALGGPGVLPQAGAQRVTVPPATHLNVQWWEDLYRNVDRNAISGRVYMIEGVHGDYFSNARNRGFLNVIDQFPNVQVLGVQPGNWNRAVSIDVTESIVLMHPQGQIDAIFAPSSEMGFGARLALEAAGRHDDVLVLTHGGTAESGDWIRDRRLLVDTWHGFPDWGWYAVKFSVMLAWGQGAQVPQFHDIGARTQWYGNADQFFPDVQLTSVNWQQIINNKR